MDGFGVAGEEHGVFLVEHGVFQVRPSAGTYREGTRRGTRRVPRRVPMNTACSELSTACPDKEKMGENLQ